MNYAELPLSERIDMASDYALLLIEDSIFNDDILTDLQERFSLTREQAADALERTRNIHSSDFRQLQNSAIFKACGSLLISIACGIFYIVIGNEVAWIFIPIGGFFLIAAYASLAVLVDKALDKFFYTPERLQKKKKVGTTGKPKIDWSVEVFVVSFFLVIIFLFDYFKKEGYISKEELRNFPMNISAPVKRVSTGGRNPSYYFVYSFRGHPNEFRFKQSFYKYCKPEFWDRTLVPGDTLSIQILKSDFYRVSMPSGDSEENKPVNIINLLLDGRPVIDIQERNHDKAKKNRVNLFITLIACTLSIPLMVARRKMIL